VDEEDVIKGGGGFGGHNISSLQSNFMLRVPIQNRRVDILTLKFRVLTRVFNFVR
jgi:hypothetical protein